MVTLTRDELRLLRSRISMSLANLGECRFYWLPGPRRLAARGQFVRRRFRLPADAVPLGTGPYAQGIGSGDVLADLAELLATLPDTPPACEAGAGGAIRTRRRRTPSPDAMQAPAGS